MTFETARARIAIPLSATIVLVATLGAIYILSQFLRNSVGVIAPDLALELSLSASQIGILASAFFFAFASAQIPLGVALDRYGPKICMLVCGAIAIGGAVLFATATTPTGLIVARVLMGLGSSSYLMAPLALYARRFSAERFATLVGIQIGIGTLGSLLATAPLAFAASLIGWRGTFLVVAGFILLAGIAIAAVVPRDEATRSDTRRETARESLAGLLEAVRTPSFGGLFLMQLMAHSSFVLVAGLWGGPYLAHIYGYDLTGRGNMLFLCVIAQIFGTFLLGPADRLCRSYKIPATAGAILSAVSFAVVAVVGVLPPWALVAWFCAIGFFTGYAVILIAHGKSLFPPHLVGRGMTLLNIGHHGRRFSDPDPQRNRHRPVSHNERRICAGCISCRFWPAGRAYPIGTSRLISARAIHGGLARDRKQILRIGQPY